MANRRDFFRTLGFAAAGAFVARGGSAQADHFQWTGKVAQGKTIEIRGVVGSIRAISSEDDSIHVDARYSEDVKVRIEVMERDEGVTICAGECQPDNGTSVQRTDVRVDFVVRVPAGVRFVGTAVNGDIEVEGLRSEVTVATISGRVNIQMTGFAARAGTVNGNVVLVLPDGQNAEFHANTVSGTIDSDFPVLFNGGLALLNGGTGPRIVRATIGKGGPDLHVTTVNGSIRLRRP